MAKTTNPLTSIEASGSIESILTFSSSKGRSYVKKFAVPANPNTADQLRARVAFSMASRMAKDWQELVTSTFGERAQREQTTARSIFVREATKGFAGGVSMTPDGLIVRVTQPSSTVTGSATVNPGSITWTWAVSSGGPLYGWLVVVSKVSTDTTLVKNAVHAAGLATTWTQTGVDPGATYYMRAFFMSTAARFIRANVVTSAVAL